MKGALKALLLALITLAASCGYTFAQVDRSSNKQFMGSVMVGTDTTALLTQNSSAWLQIGRDSTNKGLLLPRVGDTSDITDPVPGLVIFSYADSAFYVYKDHWVPVGSSRDLAAYLKKADSLTVYVTPSQTADSLTNYVNISRTQIITGAKTFNKDVIVGGQLGINGSGNNGVTTTGGYTFVGERYGAGGLTLSSNAYPTENVDVWNQKQTNIPSQLLYLGIPYGRLYEYTAPSGTSSGSFSSFWGSAAADTFARYSDMRSYVASHIPTLQQVTTAGDSTTASATFDAHDNPVSIGSGLGLDFNLNHRIGGWAKGISISQPSPTDLTLNRGGQFGVLGSDSLVNYSFWLATNDSLTNAYQTNSGMRLYPNGSLYYGTPPANTSAATKFFTLGSDGHTIGTRTASQVLSDIGAASSADVALLSDANTFTGFNYFKDAGLITDGFVEFGTPLNPTLVLGDNTSSGNLSIENYSNGKYFTFIGDGITADRTDTIPDRSGTFWMSGGNNSTTGTLTFGGGFSSGIMGFGGTPASPYATINGLGQIAAQTLSIGSTFAVDNSGNVTTAATTATQYKLSSLNTAPSSATDTGTTGDIRITSDYIYVCIATNTWVRAALSTW